MERGNIEGEGKMKRFAGYPCAYNFCKAVVASEYLPCQCTKGHIQLCCGGKNEE